MEILILGHMKRLNSMEDKFRFSAKDIALIGAMIAVIEVCKAVLSFMPNVELTTFWLIMFTLYFGRKVIAVVPAFILVEGIIYGMNTWWIMYLYIWPLLVLLTWLFRKEDSALFWAIFSGIFGLKDVQSGKCFPEHVLQSGFFYVKIRSLQQEGGEDLWLRNA